MVEYALGYALSSAMVARYQTQLPDKQMRACKHVASPGLVQTTICQGCIPLGTVKFDMHGNWCTPKKYKNHDLVQRVAGRRVEVV